MNPLFSRRPPSPPAPTLIDYKEGDIATILELRAMVTLARTDAGMLDLLSRAKEYYVLKGLTSNEMKGWPIYLNK